MYHSSSVVIVSQRSLCFYILVPIVVWRDGTIIVPGILLLSYLFIYYIVFGCGMYNVFVCLFIYFILVPAMAINVSAQYNGGLLPDIILFKEKSERTYRPSE